jgi:glycosyltransferase involved in cell wall biosynthesis
LAGLCRRIPPGRGGDFLRCDVRIAYIAAGAGDMYCGACHRDATLFRALAASGHDFLAIPLYTPLRTDQPVSCAMAPIFMGGISLYLAQSLSIFRHVPAFVRRQLDRPALLRGISRLAIQTAPAKLGKLTVGMFAGRDGPHAGEIERLIQFLRQEFRPDIVNLSNALLASLAAPLRAALNVPIVSTLQGEESFIEALPEPYRGQTLALLRRHAKSIDRFVSCAAERVPTLATWLNVPLERITVIPTGIDPKAFAPPDSPVPPAASAPPNASGPRPTALGYLSSIRPEKGLDVLIESLRELVHVHGRHVRLAIAGQVLDKRYWKRLRDTIARHDLEQRVTFHGTLDLPSKIEFLRACDLFIMPTRFPEQRALAAMEAMAAGVPVIASRRGVLPELLARTGGGITVEPENADALALGIMTLLDDPPTLRTHAANGPRGIAAHYSPEAMARQSIAEYETLIRGNITPR